MSPYQLTCPRRSCHLPWLPVAYPYPSHRFPSCSAAQLGQLIRQAIDEPSYAASAAAVRATMLAEPGADAAVAAFERAVARNPWHEWEARGGRPALEAPRFVGVWEVGTRGAVIARVLLCVALVALLASLAHVLNLWSA